MDGWMSMLRLPAHRLRDWACVRVCVFFWVALGIRSWS